MPLARGGVVGSIGRSPWRRRALIALAVLACAWPVAWLVGSRIARAVLVRETERLFDARLEIGKVDYLPPFWLVARDVALTSTVDGARVDWLSAGALRATLVGWADGASLPLARVTVERPSLTVVRTPEGVVELLDRWRGGAMPSGAVPLSALRADDARLVFVDRTTSDAAAAPALALGGFDVTLDATGAGTLALAITGGDQHLALDVRATCDLAARTITLDEVDARGRVAGGAGEQGVVAAVSVQDLRGQVLLDERSVRLDDAVVTVEGEPALRADAVQGTLVLGAGRLDATGLAARIAGGSVRGTFAVRWDEEPGWQATGEASELRLGELARRFPQLGGKSVRGIASGSGSFSGALAASEAAWLASLRGDGRMRARDGRFDAVPLVARLLEQAHLSSEAITLSDGGARFRIASGTIFLDEAAVGSKSVGVQGHGTVGFDGTVALDMVVTPLGSWGNTVRRGNVPVIGGALATLAGKVQSLVGEASGALYQFHITGTVENPHLTAVPVPALSRSATQLFDSMASGSWTGDLR